MLMKNGSRTGLIVLLFLIGAGVYYWTRGNTVLRTQTSSHAVVQEVACSVFEFSSHLKIEVVGNDAMA